jgi:hypothetical protein
MLANPKAGKVPKRAQVQVALRDTRVQRPGKPRRGREWPTFFALTQLTAAGEMKIGALVKQAVS